jgi:glycosyltransferase involved in cell wall biosynthesis
MAGRRRARELASLVVFVLVFLPLYLIVRALTALLSAIRWNRWWPRVQPRLGIRARVLYLESFFPESSGHEYRVAVWTRVLQAAGYTTRVRHPLSEKVSRALLDGGWTGVFYAAYLFRRLGQCVTAPLYSCVVVRRELLLYNDYGNLFLERLLLALNANVVLDFDDDIGALKREPRTLTIVGRMLAENPRKFGDSLRLYPGFIAGSEYLRNLVTEERTEDAAIEVIPTCVSYGDQPVKAYGGRPQTITLGWIGTDANVPQLARIVPDLEALSREVPLRLTVIADRGLDLPTSFPIENKRWSLQTQIPDLLEVDIGLMPLKDTPVERGKCGFKLLQYMGLGIVGVASAVTTNREIVSDGVDGFLVEPGESWAEALHRVFEWWNEFPEIGAAARARIERSYSVAARTDAYLSFMNRMCVRQFKVAA